MIRRPIRAFIGSPFLLCPNCAAVRFGVVLVFPTQVLRQCNVCGWEARAPLPAQQARKIVYIDQFLISDYAKLIANPNLLTEIHIHKRKALAVVARLHACQLIVCPKSEHHERESVMDSRHQQFRSAYEKLSSGARWNLTAHIEAAQAYYHAKAWISGTVHAWTFPANEALRGLPRGWDPHFQVQVDMGDHDDVRVRAQRSSDNSTRDLAAIAEGWRSSGATFASVFQAEVRQPGRTHLKYHIRDVRVYQEAIAARDPGAFLLHPDETWSGCWLRSAFRAFQEAGVLPAELWRMMRQYAEEGDFTTLPYQRIASSLWGAWAAQVVHRNARAPANGTGNDISIVATFMPYCDAMFIDKAQLARLRELPTGHLTFPTRMFSFTMIDEFVAWGQELEQAMTTEHRACLKDVYGVDVEHLPWDPHAMS